MTANTNTQDALSEVEDTSDTDARIDALEDLVATLVKENDRLATKLEKLESLVISQSQTIEELREDVDGLDEEQYDIRRHVESRATGLTKRVHKLEQTLEAGVDYRIEANLSPIERYLVWGPEATQVQDTATVRRAAILVQHFRDWATPGTRTGTLRIVSKPNKGVSLRERMRDACEENLDWVQIYRAMEKASALSDGKLVHEKDDTAGHTLALAPDAQVPITTERHLMEVEERLSANDPHDDE